MMRRLIAVAGAALLLAGSANATLIHDYEFTTGLGDAVAGGTALQPSFRDPATGTVSGGFYDFQRGAGLTLASQLPGATYTIDISTAFDTIDGYRKLISFNDLGSDDGLYVDSGALQLYGTNGTGAIGVVTAGTPFTVRLTRDGSTDLVTGYINGVQQFQVSDARNEFAATTQLWFLRDDTRQNGEDSAGSSDYIRIYDDTVGAPPVTTPSAVPEPASWAMFIGGFGLVGGAMRRRTRIAFA